MFVIPFLSSLSLGVLVRATLLSDHLTEVPLRSHRGGASEACDKLKGVAPAQVLLPNTSAYEHDQAAYWSLQQTELRPHCRFLPDSATHLRDALDAAIFLNATVAVVSGGHSSNHGASNVHDGLTIDLATLTGIYLSEDQESVSIGPAARWSDVYATLEVHGLTVAGGRAGHVGVGGYVLGGGFSWLANEQGWACDSVTEFGVITPSLEMLWANSTSHADLFWALKGSLGAFGVVFSIRMKTIPSVGFYGGGISYEEEALPAVFAGLKQMARDAETYRTTSGYLSFAYLASIGEFVYTTYLIDTANSSASPDIGNFLMIPHKGHNLRYMTPKESADEVAKSNPIGLRRSKYTITILPTMEAMRLIHEFVKSFAQQLQLADNDLLGVTYQPLTGPHLRKQKNIFESIIIADYGPLLLVSIELSWKDEAKSKVYEKEFRAACEDGIGYALKWMLVTHSWIYPNYAARWQEPLDLWHWYEEDRRRLQKVRERYDPDDVWRSLVPGIWHI